MQCVRELAASNAPVTGHTARQRPTSDTSLTSKPVKRVKHSNVLSVGSQDSKIFILHRALGAL